MAPPPLPPLMIRDSQQKQGLSEQALEILDRIVKLREARPGEPSEIRANAVEYYKLASFEFDRYEQAEKREKGSGAESLGNALGYVEKSLQADKSLAEAICAKVIIYYKCLPPSEENTKIAVESFEGLQKILSVEEEIARKMPIPKILRDEEVPALKRTRSRFRPMLKAACERVGAADKLEQAYMFLYVRKGAKFLPEEYARVLQKIFVESGMTEEKAKTLTDLPHTEPKKADNKKNVELAKKLVQSMSEESGKSEGPGKPTEPPPETAPKKEEKAPKPKLGEKKKALEKVGIRADSPSVIAVAKNLFGENLDKPIHSGNAVQLSRVSKDAFVMLGPESEVLEKYRKWHRTGNDQDARRAEKAYYRACWRVGAALLNFAPNYNELDPYKRKDIAQNIGGSISVALQAYHNEITGAQKKPAHVPRVAAKTEAPKESKQRLEHAGRMGRLEVILFGSDGMRSLSEIFEGHKISSKAPKYRNPFDRILACPGYKEVNAQVIREAMGDKISWAGPAGGGVAAQVITAERLLALQAAAAEKITEQLLTLDPRRKEIESNPALKNIIIEKLSESLLGCYLGREPVLKHNKGRRDSVDSAAPKVAPAPGTSYQEKQKAREALASALEARARELKKERLFSIKEIDRAITIVDTHKDAIGKGMREDFKIRLNALRPKGKLEKGEKQPSRKDLTSLLNTMAKEVRQLGSKEK